MKGSTGISGVASSSGWSAIALTITTALLVAACGPEVASTSTPSVATTTITTSSTTTIATAATTTTQPATTTTAVDSNDLASGSGCTPGPGPLPDGIWFGFVAERESTSIEFDLACWFFGDAATIAAAEDGEESPPPNDYYIRNESDRTRTITLVDRAEVTYYPDGDPNNVIVVEYPGWADLVEQRGYELGVWLTVEDGVVTAIEEQWVP